MWQSTWGKWWLTYWSSLLRWIWSISEYNLTTTDSPKWTLESGPSIPKWPSKTRNGIVHHKSDRKLCVIPTADRNTPCSPTYLYYFLLLPAPGTFWPHSPRSLKPPCRASPLSEWKWKCWKCPLICLSWQYSDVTSGSTWHHAEIMMLWHVIWP